MVVLLGILIVDAVVGASIPLFFRAIIDNGIAPHDKTAIIALSCGLAVVAVADQALGVVGTFVSARIGQGIVFDLRSAVYRHVQQLPIAFFTRTDTGALMSRLDNDVNGAQQAFSDLFSVVTGSAMTLTISVIVMFTLSWQFTLLALIALPVGGLVARLAGRRVAGLARANLQLLSTLNSHMSERFNVGGAMLVALFGRPKNELETFERTSGQVRDLGVRVAVYSRSLVAVLLAVSGIVTAVIFGWGGILVTEGTLQLGTVVALVTYLGRIYGPMVTLGNAPVDVMTALVSFERLFEVLDIPAGIGQRAGAREIPSGPPRLVVEHVDFAYPADDVTIPSLEPDGAIHERARAQVLFDVSLTIEPGRVVALVGHTGAGKTTLSYLVRRLYDVGSGSISINGLDVRDATLESLRDRVGMVSQDVHLFHGSIRDNLLYAKPDATEAEVGAALEQCQLVETIRELPDGLDTIVGDRGYLLSGGQKQRLALARVLLRNPSVVILDEATSHLDAVTERAIQGALRHALRGRTALVIAHRPSTIRDADEVVVLDAGRIVDRGTHHELVRRSPTYARLSLSDLDDHVSELVSGTD
jgi:ATP-binding cassette subfamily B protein